MTTGRDWQPISYGRRRRNRAAIAGPVSTCYRPLVDMVRHPLVPIGLVLMVLGAGNWYAGWDKIEEHERLLAAKRRAAHRAAFDDFPNLTTRTNEALLRGFQGGSDTAELAGVKLDFYRVVQAGGRFLFLLGSLSVGAGIIHGVYRSRSGRRRVEATAPASPG